MVLSPSQMVIHGKPLGRGAQARTFENLTQRLVIKGWTVRITPAELLARAHCITNAPSERHGTGQAPEVPATIPSSHRLSIVRPLDSRVNHVLD